VDSRYSVLVVDDDEAHRETLVELLTARGHLAHAAESGDRALEIVRRRVIHAGILDVHMPGLTGIETCRRMLEIVESLPLILMSAEATRGLRVDAMDAGAVSFLTKPIDVERLLGMVDGLLRERHGDRRGGRLDPFGPF
jgi:DNA-binding response OmpR family regulator